MLVAVDRSRVGGRPHGGLGGEDDLAGCGSGPRGQFLGRRDGIIGDLEREPVSHGGVGVEAHAEQQRRPGRLHTDGALQHPRRTPTGMDAEFLETRIEQRSGPGDAHIGGEREVESRADGGAVDGRDRRERAVGHREEAVVDRAEPVLGRLAERRQVRARAERLARPGDDERVHVGVRLGLVDGCAQGRRDLGGDGVATLGIVDGDERDVVLDLDEDSIGHRLRLVTAYRVAWTGPRIWQLSAGSVGTMMPQPRPLDR